MRFSKLQGLGNDFILIDGFGPYADRDWPTLAVRMCDRHFGIGADGVLLLLPSTRADVRMRVYNSDGSEAEMCGNGLRCAAVFVRDIGRVTKERFTVETLAGDLSVEVRGDTVTVDMGVPELRSERIPVASETNRVKLMPGDTELDFFCVSMGNPHAVTFSAYPDRETFLHWGPILETHELFPRRANVEFCRVRDGGIDVRVWERGDGETLACGTGACAVLTAAATLGLTGREADVRLPGGTLHIRWAENDHIFMTGPAVTVYTGEWIDEQ